MLKIFVNLILCLYTGKKIRDIEMEEKMEELQDKIRELEKHNLQYKEKVIFRDTAVFCQGCVVVFFVPFDQGCGNSKIFY